MFQIIKVLAELLHFLRLRQELELRRQLWEEMDRVSAESDKLEDDVAAARRAGMPAVADRLLERQTDLLRYRVGLRRVAQGADLRGPAGHDPGDGKRGPAEGSADPGPAGGEQATAPRVPVPKG